MFVCQSWCNRIDDNIRSQEVQVLMPTVIERNVKNKGSITSPAESVFAGLFVNGLLFKVTGLGFVPDNPPYGGVASECITLRRLASGQPRLILTDTA